MTTTDLIRYDLLTQEALRGVVRKVLGDAARFGLPGDHHFFVTFNTTAAGVRLSSRLREQYPEEMTIVIQHQYRDLGVTEHTFEIGLSFGGIPERLLIPFAAITKFVDPAVSFGLQFETLLENSDARAEADKGASGIDSAGAADPVALPVRDAPIRSAPLPDVENSSQVVRLDHFRKK